MQVKNGVDCIKIAMDGTQMCENGELWPRSPRKRRAPW